MLRILTELVHVEWVKHFGVLLTEWSLISEEQGASEGLGAVTSQGLSAQA